MNEGVIILSYHMIPNTRIWGAAQRCFYLANQLVNDGFEVSVVHGTYGTYKHDGKYAKFEQYPISIRPRFIQRYQERVGRGYESHGASTTLRNRFNLRHKSVQILKHVYKKIDQMIFNDFGSVGFIMHFWNKEARKKLRQIISTRRIKVVILSGPYFTTFSNAAWIRKNYPEMKIILDYRDPWSLLRKGTYISQKLEINALKFADAYTFFSQRFSLDMQNRFNLPREKCLVMYNGYDSQLWNRIKKEVPIRREKNLIITYAGSDLTFNANSGRNPHNLIAAVNSAHCCKHITLNLVGCVDKPNLGATPVDKAQINLIGKLSHEDSLRELDRSDVVIVLSSDINPSKYTVTGKLFDCIASGKHILGIANSEDVDYMKMIRDFGLGTISSNSVDELGQVIGDLYIQKQKGTLTTNPADELNTFSRYYQNSVLVNWIKQSLLEQDIKI